MSEIAGALGKLLPKASPKVWRAKIHAKELLSCGFNAEAPDGGWSVIKGILKAKGLPEHFTADGTPFKADELDDGIMLEFGS